MSVLAPPRPDAERIPDGPSQLPAPPRSRVERFWRGPRSDPAWVRPALLALLLTTAAMYLWNLGASGWANSYYSAAVQAGTKSWKAFFFGSTDSSNFITVDKIPGSLWIMELSARLFGVNAWSILVPQALEGVAAVGILFAAVKRWFSPAAALIAGGVFALTPVAALMFRFNNPDALLVLLLVCAAYAMTRALEAGRLRWILAAGALVGFGFLAKELQAFVVLPVFALVYLIAGPPKLTRRFAHVIAMGLAALLAGGWWVAIVQLWPASSRPYIGGSQNNSFWNVLFGYNGFGRLTGNESGSVVGGGATGTAGQWGPTGWTRMFNTSFGGQISWLLPAALILLAGGLVLTARRARTDRARAALLLWGGWLLVTGAAFSFGQGIIHQYYTVALAPAMGAVIGIGATLLWSHRDRVVVRALLGGTIAVTGWWAYELLGRAPNWNPALRTVVLAASVVVGVIVAVAPKSRGRFGVALAVGALAIGITAPAAYTLSTVTTPHTGAIPIAGPSCAGAFPGGAPGARRALRRPARRQRQPRRTALRRRAPQRRRASQRSRVPNPAGTIAPGGANARSAQNRGGIGGLLDSSTPGSQLTALLRKSTGYRWTAAAVRANDAAGYQLASGRAIMAIGGFNGTDPTPTLAQFERMVKAHEIHYFIGGGRGGGFGFGPGGSNASSTSSQISQWVQSNFTAKTVNGVTVYDLSAPTTGRAQ